MRFGFAGMKDDRPRIGAAAPAFSFRDAAGRVISSAAFRGAPVVLAFAPAHWTMADEGDDGIEAIRADLRGLGAILVVVARAGIWTVRPDDDPDLLEARCPSVRDEIERIAVAYRAGCAARVRAPALFVIDAKGRVRFAAEAIDAGAFGATIAFALGAAGRALLARRPGAGMMTRREWVTKSLVASFTLALLDACGSGEQRPGEGKPAAAPSEDDVVRDEVDVTLDVNGVERTLRIEPRVSLLDALRERLLLTGTKKGCDHGQCGACTVHVDGRRINACLTLAIMAQGSKIVTIEGLASGKDLHPMQRAFLAEDAFQCGYCTPGQIMSAVALLQEGRARDPADIRERMSGNLCRCGAYPNIVAAIQRARKEA